MVKASNPRPRCPSAFAQAGARFARGAEARKRGAGAGQRGKCGIVGSVPPRGAARGGDLAAWDGPSASGDLFFLWMRVEH
jgi:hypothetical protein